jgi:hypothetical protein
MNYRLFFDAGDSQKQSVIPHIKMAVHIANQTFPEAVPI